MEINEIIFVLQDLKANQVDWNIEWAKNIEPELSENDKRTIFIGGLNPKVKEADVKEKFFKYGKITSLSLVSPSDGKTSNYLYYSQL